jgi:hypothetical protein
MGLFGDVRKLQKQAKEMRQNHDPKSMLGNAMASMQAANQMMADQTRLAEVATNGVEASAVITEVSQGSTTINDQPMLKLGLTVMPEGRPPYPATVSQPVPQLYLSKATAGATLPVKVDSADPALVWINWPAA